ncbi:MAG: phage minor head protein, partial [Kiritimatiellaeota bacterium]|nr:phage minor head protein [Kiritimatiellota bacterium]
MSFFATEPMTFTAARDFLAQKVNLPTQLGSLDLSLKVPARIRAQAFFSARVASANIVQGLRTEVEAVARGDYNYAEARGRLTTFLARQGYGIPDVGTKADQDLTNLASTRRLDLILRQNVAMAHAVGQREVAENPAVMEDLPCYEYLPSGAQHPRTEHMQFYGLILPKNDPFWATHYPPWEFGCDCAIGQTDAPPNAKTSGFKPGAPMDGHLDYNGRMTQLTGNESGFEFDSTPAAAFAEPDFSRIEDPDLRGQVETAFQQKFSMVKLSALTPAARKIKGSSEKPVALAATEAQAIHDWSSPEFEPMRTAMQASEAGLSAEPAALEKVAQLRSALQRLPA